MDHVDLGMVERSQHLSLSSKAGHSLAILDKLLRQDLQRYFPSQTGAGGPVDLPHPAFAELGGDLIVGDVLAYQREPPS